MDDAGYADLKAQYDAKYAEWQAAYQAAGADTTDTGMTGTEIANLDISDNLAELAAMTPRELLEKGRHGRSDRLGGCTPVQHGITGYGSLYDRQH